MQERLAKRAGQSSRRIIGALLFLAVFFAPLHLHSASTKVEIGKECACLEGTRIQLALAPPAADCTPYIQVAFLSAIQSRFSTFLTTGTHSIRAPPIF